MKRTKEELTAMMEEEMRLAGWHKKKFEEHLDRALALAEKKMGITSFGTGLRTKRTKRICPQYVMQFEEGENQ